MAGLNITGLIGAHDPFCISILNKVIDATPQEIATFKKPEEKKPTTRNQGSPLSTSEWWNE